MRTISARKCSGRRTLFDRLLRAGWASLVSGAVALGAGNALGGEAESAPVPPTPAPPKAATTADVAVAKLPPEPAPMKPVTLDDLIDNIPFESLDDGVVLQSGAIRVTHNAVEKVLLAYVAGETRRNPDYKLHEKTKTFLRKRFAFRFLANALVEKYVVDNKLEMPKETFEEQFAAFKKKKQQESNTSSYEQWLADNGLSDEEFRRFWAANWAIERKIDSQVTKDDVEKSFAAYQDNLPLRRAAHILILFKGDARAQAGITRTREEALAEAEGVLKKLKAGEDFLKLALSSSDCRSRFEGGDLGWIPPKGGSVDVFGHAFNDAVYALAKVDDWSPAPIESKYGFHVVRLLEIRQADEVKQDVRRHLVAQQYQKQMQQLMDTAALAAKFNEKEFPDAQKVKYE